MVVNGQTEFVGSNVAQSNEALSLSLQHSAEDQLKITAQWNATHDEIVVNYQTNATIGDKNLVLAIVQKRAGNQVTTGENQGRKLVHVNVVRELQTVKTPKNSGSKAIPVPYNITGDDWEVIAFLQDSSNRQITAADRTDL